MLKAQGKSNEQTGTKILLEAMSKDKVHLARFVLDALDGEIVDCKTEDAQTPLISSILLPDGHTRCKFVELLLQKGASVNCPDGTGRTALSYACEQGSLDAVKILVRHNADPEVVDVWGNTALMYATVSGHSHVVEFLVRSFKRLGLRIDRQNKVGNSAVEVAKFLGHTECVFALTNSFKKNREAQGNAQPRLSLGSVDVNDTFGRRVGHFVNKLEDFQKCDHADCLLVPNWSWPTRPRVKQSRLPSMDSIEEFEREQDACSSPPQLVFSGVLTPKPPPRTSDHHNNFTHPKTGDDHLPLPKLSCEAQTSYFPSGNIHRPSAPSALGILLSPIPSNKSEADSVTDTSKTLEFGVRRFCDSYYEKRCSLPTSILRPTPPDRTLVPVRKSRTVRRREASPCRAEPPPFTALTSTTSNTTFSVLSNKLLRRFTSPEIKKNPKELEESPMLASGRIPRSETFPQCRKHPQVDSKPSIDSISSVKCEFGIFK
ncbi:Ankyrin repeat domain containing protein 63 [Dissostichus eleginoides]|uniref:Ankyrin repeat domain containing protein 63 n=1 Tax=Dissostichus eleginoides TaxID=100907 RepID=A0AAD9BWN4_DISEL|nr:Ankyrin repeat domain containing protein 63 [Dissostichus eleginoides]